MTPRASLGASLEERTELGSMRYENSGEPNHARHSAGPPQRPFLAGPGLAGMLATRWGRKTKRRENLTPICLDGWPKKSPPRRKQESGVYVLVYRSLLRPRVYPIAHYKPVQFPPISSVRPRRFVCGKADAEIRSVRYDGGCVRLRAGGSVAQTQRICRAH